MKVAIITTVRHNVGDDFVREGILYLLKREVASIEPLLIHKHIPVTVRPELDWYYRLGASRALDQLPKAAGLKGSKLLDSLPFSPTSDKILSSDLVVQSGAPIYWCGEDNTCANAEWFEPLIERRWKLISERVPLLNIAGGTSAPYGSDGSEFSNATLVHIQKFFDYCKLTTLRDHLSRKILQKAGREAAVLPCTSIFARRNLGFRPEQPDFVALNYMPDAGNPEHRHLADEDHWRSTFVQFACDLSKRESCVLVCHDQKELRAAKRWFPSIPRYYSSDYRQILKFYQRARFGIMNRIHGAFAIASYGRPAFVIGTDTRAQMTEMIGLRNCAVWEATPELLLEEVGRLASSEKAYSQQFDHSYARAETAYRSLLQNAIER